MQVIEDCLFRQNNRCMEIPKNPTNRNNTPSFTWFVARGVCHPEFYGSVSVCEMTSGFVKRMRPCHS